MKKRRLSLGIATHSAIAAASTIVLNKPEQPTAREIKEFREALGMTQAQFAKEFNISIGTLQRWEQERNVPRTSNPLISMWRRLAREHRAPKARRKPNASAVHVREANSNSKDNADAPSKTSTFFGAAVSFCGPEFLSSHHVAASSVAGLWS